MEENVYIFPSDYEFEKVSHAIDLKACLILDAFQVSVLSTVSSAKIIS